ncbi:MAG: porin family protein [Bacteroidales bacterium]|nr:porin family protein [Bacteroidales bacterium]
MRTIVISAILILLSSLAFAQKEVYDVVYLKDGSIIRGELIEIIPEEKVKIKSAGNTLSFPMSEVKKVIRDTAKEKKDKQVEQKLPSRDFENYRKGFIGLSFGPSFPTGNYGSDSQSVYTGSSVIKGYAREGLKMNFLVLSYQFHKNIGAALFWRKTAHEKIKSGYQKDYWFNSSYLAGPAFIIPLEKTVSLVLKPMAGVGITTLRDEGYKYSAFAFDLTGELRYDLSDRWRINVGGDYYYSRLQMDNPKGELDNTVLSINLGFGYRFDL